MHKHSASVGRSVGGSVCICVVLLHSLFSWTDVIVSNLSCFWSFALLMLLCFVYHASVLCIFSIYLHRPTNFERKKIEEDFFSLFAILVHTYVKGETRCQWNLIIWKHPKLFAVKSWNKQKSLNWNESFCNLCSACCLIYIKFLCLLCKGKNEMFAENLIQWTRLWEISCKLHWAKLNIVMLVAGMPVKSEVRPVSYVSTPIKLNLI